MKSIIILSLMLFGAGASAGFKAGDSVLLTTLKHYPTYLQYEGVVKSEQPLKGGQDLLTIYFPSISQNVGVRVLEYDQDGGSTRLELDGTSQIQGDLRSLVGTSVREVWNGRAEQDITFARGQRILIGPTFKYGVELKLDQSSFEIQDATINLMYTTNPTEVKYWYPQLSLLSVQVGEKKSLTSIASILIDLADDNQKCVYVQNERSVLLETPRDKNRNAFELCVGDNTTWGPVTRLLRSATITMIDLDAKVFVELNQNGKRMTYEVSGGLPFGVQN